MQSTAEGRLGEATIRLGVCTATHAGDEEPRRQCVARVGIRWEPETERTGDEELRRQCVARIGVLWSRLPSPPAQDSDAHAGDRSSPTLGGEGEGGWMSEAYTSTVSSPVGRDSEGDPAQYQAVAGSLAGGVTWFDEWTRMAHEAEDADRRQRDTADENRRLRDRLDAAQKDASGWRRVAEDMSLVSETLKAEAEEAGESAKRCSDLLRQAADDQGTWEEELARVRHSEQGALGRAADAEDKSLVLQSRVQALTVRAGKADAASIMLREELLTTRARYEEKLAQANRDIDMRTQELNSMQDRLDEVIGEKGQKKRPAGE